MIIKTEDGGGVWVNIYKTQTVEGDEIYWTGSVGYSTKENASTDLADRKHYIATIDIKQALCSMEKIEIQAHQLGNQGYRIHNQRKEIERQAAQNAKLKELLMQSRIYVKIDTEDYEDRTVSKAEKAEARKLLTKIDEVLK